VHRHDGNRWTAPNGYHRRVSYRDDVDAMFARIQALQRDVARLQAERDAPRVEERGPLAASAAPKTVGWIAPLIDKLPAVEQELIADLVTLFTTRREYPALDTVSGEALDKLVARLRASFKR
jgi:hypothetical protein